MRVCSRLSDIAATDGAESGTASRFSLENAVPPGRHNNGDADTSTGNPDIRVPEEFEREDGLRAGDAKGHENADRGAERKDKRMEDTGKKTEERRKPGNQQPRPVGEPGKTRRTRNPPRPRRDVASPGSSYTLLSEKVWKEYFNHIELRKSDIGPVGYGGKPVKVLGEHEVELRFQVMEDEWMEARGRDEQRKEIMEGIIQGWSVCKSVQCEAYKHVFEELSVVNNMLMCAGVLVVPEDSSWKMAIEWNKERLSLARDVELLNKTGDESREEQETRHILRKNSPCDMKLLDKELKRSAKEEYVTKDKKRNTSSRSIMLPSKYRDFVLFV
ncbi:hypothetical protein NDU88_001135 [Pleurodeles waltl]|uniref:Uncharacterized protein n=1 Tax=Pleurodeles waltl TaxID=8319 RepID=A0AAV7WHG4_PLEWA|nr:hypothetical protein NDU88_001135 [Pleurodeles waltl]